MAYAILRTSKLKSYGSVSSAIQHATRDRETKNADPDKLHLNECLVKYNPEEYARRVEECRTRPMRGTANDNVMCIEILLTTSPEYWEGKSQNDLDEWKIENVKYLEEKFGKGNIFALYLHNDETTPHISGFIIPDVDGRLNATPWLDGRRKMTAMQTHYAEQMQHLGLQRGERGSKAEHQTVQEYYAELQKIKSETLVQNPKEKLNVDPQLLRDPSLSDRINMDKYKEEIIKDTVKIMQSKVDEITKKNQNLTSKLLTAENKIKRQTAELTEHRAITSKNHDKIINYDNMASELASVKKIISNPEIQKLIYVEENPQIKWARIYRNEGMSDEKIAYELLKKRITQEKTCEAINYDGGFRYNTTEIVANAAKQLDADKIAKIAEQAELKLKTEQDQARANQVQRDQQLAQKRKNHIEKNPNIKRYLQLASRITEEKVIANKMLTEGFNRNDVITAIATESPRQSNDMKKYATDVVKEVEKEIKSDLKSQGGNMVMGRGESKKIEQNSKSIVSEILNKIVNPDVQMATLTAYTEQESLDLEGMTTEQRKNAIAEMDHEEQ